MKIINIQQGSPEWHEHRAKYDNASEAPAALNESPYVKRDELIHAKKTGDVKQFSDFVQRYILDKGHRFEALARPLAEAILDDDLSPLVGVSGNNSASFDGLTFCRRKGFEHKMMNNAIRAAFTVDELPVYYRIQMEHQLMVCDGELVLFMATRWEPVAEDYEEDGATFGYAENERGELTRYKLAEQKHFFYYPDLELRQRIIDGWNQLRKDVAAYEPTIIESAPQATEIADLPAIVVEGNTFPDKMARDSYTKQATALLAPTKTVPANQQEAGDLLVRVEKVTEAEQLFKRMIEQTNVSEADRDAFRKWLVDMQKAFSKGRIDGGKNLEAFKANQKTEMVNAAKKALSEHIADLDAALQRPFMPEIDADFWSVLKGKSNPKNMQNDINALLAEKKIEADKAFAAIKTNLDAFAELAAGNESLFDADLHELCQKDADSFRAVVRMRIADAAEAEEKRRATSLSDVLHAVAPEAIVTAMTAPEHSVVVLVDPAAPGADVTVDTATGEVIATASETTHAAAPVASLTPSYRKPSARDELMRTVMRLTDSEVELVQHYVERLIGQREAAA